MINIKKIFNKEILKEDWGDLVSISSEVRKKLKYKFKDSFGKNSKVKILHLTGKELFQLITTDKNILAIIIRYGQEDIAFLKNDSSSWKTEIDVDSLEGIEEINDTLDYSARFSVSRTFKSESGCIKLCNDIINFLFKLSSSDYFSYIPNNKQEIAKKINFQVIYVDEEKKKLQQQRSLNSQSNKTVTVNNITTPSNKTFESNTLKSRLKEFIQNKLPHYEDVKQLPKDMSLFKENTQFKLFGCVYKFEGYNSISLKKLLLNKTGYINFENEYRYNYTNHFNEYPRDIVFEIGLNNQYQLYVKNIYFYAGSNYSYSVDELQPIEQFTAYIANIKNKSNEEE